MKITLEWLYAKGAYSDGLNWFRAQAETDATAVIKSLIEATHYSWALWIITRLLAQKYNVLLACYSAKQSLANFEKAFPDDKRPRLAIKAAEAWAKNPTEENRSAAWSASAESAWSASAWSASAWSASAESASSAARSAAWLKILTYAITLMRRG